MTNNFLSKFKVSKRIEAFNTIGTKNALLNYKNFLDFSMFPVILIFVRESLVRRIRWQ